MIKVFEYPKCSTCVEVKKELQKNNINNIKYINVKEEVPKIEDLKKLIEVNNIDVKKLFNTSGLVYKSLNLKEKLPKLTDEEKLEILLTNGMLIKRPLLMDFENNQILVGKKEVLSITNK